MAAFVFGALLLAACLGAAWWFSQQKTDDAARMVRIILGSGALIAGVVICLRGAVILGGYGVIGYLAAKAGVFAVRQGVRAPALILAAFLGAFVFHALLGHPRPEP